MRSFCVYNVFQKKCIWQLYKSERTGVEKNFFGGFSQIETNITFTVLLATYGRPTNVKGQEGQVTFFGGYSHFYHLSPFQCLPHQSHCPLHLGSCFIFRFIIILNFQQLFWYSDQKVHVWKSSLQFQAMHFRWKQQAWVARLSTFINILQTEY